MARKQRYKMGESVYLRTGTDREPRIITQITAFPGGKKYELSWGLETSWHYEIEFTRERANRVEVRGLGK